MFVIYDPWTHALKLGIQIVPGPCRFFGKDDYKLRLDEAMILVRQGTSPTRARSALGVGLAERDLLREGRRFRISDHVELAARRFIPFDHLVESATVHRGAIGLIAADFGLTARLALVRIHTLSIPERYQYDSALRSVTSRAGILRAADKAAV